MKHTKIDINAVIIDYGMGNIFSIKHACRHVGITPIITNSKKDIENADIIILPGVGAFADAMNALSKLDLINPLIDLIDSDKILFGICLGMQLLMTESYEFGHHNGLGIIQGKVVKFFDQTNETQKELKVPHIGWNHIYYSINDCIYFKNIKDESYMYFVHSFYAIPKDVNVISSYSLYGNTSLCSSIKYKNIFACQFHPERSGSKGLEIYKTLASIIQTQKQENNNG